MPLAAVTPAGWVMVSKGSTTAIVGRSRAWLIPVLTCSFSTSRTQIVVLSEPVPVVVGTATSGLSGFVGFLPPPTGALMYSSSSPGLVVIRLMALAVSMLDPPPTATKASQGPDSRAHSTASRRLSSVGSTCTRSNTSASRSNSFIWSATRCGQPVAATPASVTTSTREAPYWLRSKPISPAEPGPNFSRGAP